MNDLSKVLSLDLDFKFKELSAKQNRSENEQTLLVDIVKEFARRRGFNHAGYYSKG